MSVPVRKFARFYYDDFIREFPDVYADDAAFAAWMRLLVRGEKDWPTLPELPRSVKPRAVRVLVEAGLIELGDSHCYRIRGLDAERSRRQGLARNAAAVRWDSASSANGNASASASAMPRQDKQSRAEPTRDDPADDYWTLTGKYPTDRILEWIDDLALTYGTDALRRHLAERATESPETKTLLGRVRDSLKREARQLDRSERAIEERKVEAGRQARANVTLLRAYHNGGAHLEDPKPECPLCSTEPAA